MMSVESYIEKYFDEGSRPSKQAVWRWIRQGLLPAKRLGKRYYIHERDAERGLGYDRLIEWDDRESKITKTCHRIAT